MSVEALITDARGYAAGIVDDAATALDDAQDLVRQVGFVVPNFYPVTLPSTPPSSISLTLPTLDTVTLDLPVEPDDTLLFQDISPIEPGTAPVLTAVAPTVTMPTAPNQLAEFTQTAPVINTSLVFPDPPSELTNPLISAPVLVDRDEPDKPQVTLPTFDATAPVDTTTAPTNLQTTFENAYQGAAPSTIAMMDGYVDAMLAKFNPRYHEQMARIETQLATYLEGGTGLKPAVENAIYERSKTKSNAESLRVQRANWADAAARGFTLPMGSLTSANQQARQAAADNNAQAAREIVVMQAEYEQKNLQFAVTQSQNMRQTMLSAALGYHQNLIGINGQAIDYAKYVVGMLIEVYNTAVKAFGLKLDAYRAEAAVYETRLKSALAGIELYKVEIDALQALTQVDKAKVDVYRARIDSLTAYANVYRAQIEAVQGRASLEKMKLEVFQTQVETYRAQVQGKNAEWQGYSAAIEGQTARVKIFDTQVNAFQAEVQSYKTRIEAQGEVVRAQALTNKARSDQYSATLSGYQAVVGARGDVAKIKLDNQRQVIVAFQAQTQAAVSNAQVAQGYYEATSRVGIANAELQMKAMLGEVDSRRDYGKTVADLGVSSAKIYGDLASSAMAGMNTLSAETLAT